MKTVIVTGGAGFIGSAVVRHLLDHKVHRVVVLDALTYAGNRESLPPEEAFSGRFVFETGDIREAGRVEAIFAAYRPDAIMHLAAESHVDRSIDGPDDFLSTNVLGTYVLLEATRRYLRELDDEVRRAFRFLHVSTDEVFGSLGDDGLFSETTPYDPSSPYSATKAASDHLVRSWGRTFGVPAIVTNCSNNYGPHQFPEKLIPHMILSAVNGDPLPIYGNGENVRDWIHVGDHARGLVMALEHGVPGETYLFGGGAERRNLDVVEAIVRILDRISPLPGDKSYSEQVAFVRDRPGHDYRYAIDSSKALRDLGWTPNFSFESGLEQTVKWYLDNPGWWMPIRAGRYSGERLGGE